MNSLVISTIFIATSVISTNVFAVQSNILFWRTSIGIHGGFLRPTVMAYSTLGHRATAGGRDLIANSRIERETAAGNENWPAHDRPLQVSR